MECNIEDYTSVHSKLSVIVAIHQMPAYLA